MLEAILLCVFTGAVMFTLIGIIYRSVGTRGGSMVDMYILANGPAGLGLLLLSQFTGGSRGTPEGSLWILFSGALGGAGMILMQRAMRSDKPGAAWSIAQSALIGPYLFMMMRGEKFSNFQVIGVAAVLVGVLALGMFQSRGAKTPAPGRDGGAPQTRRLPVWLWYSFAAFAVLAVSQSVATVASSFAVPMGNFWRGGLYCLGGVFLALCCKPFGGGMKLDLTRRTLVPAAWLLVVASLTISSQFAAFDAMKRADISGLSCSLIQGCCIVVFFVYSALVYREKSNRRARAALALILLGIAFLSIK